MRIRTLVVLASLALATPAQAQFASVRVQIVDVGQADGILVRTPNSRWILIDGGQDRLFADSLRSQFGVDRLAIAFASHRHRDHIGALDEAIRNVGTDLFVGDTAEYHSGKDDDRLRDALGAGDVPVRVRGATADTIVVDSVRFIVLPAPPSDSSNENNNSVIVRLEFGEFSMLFVGDAEEDERDWLVDNVPQLLDVDVLKASHHGSSNGTSDRWLQAITPQHVVISAGVHKGFKHPHGVAVAAYVQATGGKLHCTNRHGTIRVFGFPDGRIRVNHQRASTASCVFVPPT
jgi:competence protein ComEC